MLRAFQSLFLGIVAGAGTAIAQEVNRNVNVLDPNSYVTREIMPLVWVALGFSVVVLLVTGGALWYVVNRFRAKPNEKVIQPGDKNEPAQFHGNNTLEAVLIGVPVVIVAVLSILTAQKLSAINKVPAPYLKVQVDGWQFWWDFKYTDLNIRNSNELIVPVGKPVELKISGKDVIHSFGVVNLTGRKDAIPGGTNKLTIIAEKEGVYYGQCFELCGPSHANMLFRVIAVPLDQFEKFVKTAQDFSPENSWASQNIASDQTEKITAGKTAFEASCAACHAVKGTTAAGIAGPDLSYYGNRTTLGAGIFKPEHSKLMSWIKNSAKEKPGSFMPPFDGSQYWNMAAKKRVTSTKLSDQDIDNIATYLESLKLTEFDFTKVPEL